MHTLIIAHTPPYTHPAHYNKHDKQKECAIANSPWPKLCFSNQGDKIKTKQNKQKQQKKYYFKTLKNR